MQKQGSLSSETIVATIMSNMGLEAAMKDMGLQLFRARVGDKYVLEEMLKLGSNLGGEQSGHTILLDHFPTGDGMLTSIKMLEAMVSQEAKLSELVADYHEYPQVLKNVLVSEKIEFDQIPELADTIADVEDKLGHNGRLNVRYSGTELLARVMVEGRDLDEIEGHAQSIVSIFAKHLRREP
jgi:phosphoglucosamine mutase